MVEEVNSCSKGLTSACFQTEPEQAKQAFALRLLDATTGATYRKRLQKMIGVPLPERVAEMISSMPAVSVPPGVFSAVPPVLVSVWDGGPVHITQAEEGEIVMPLVRRKKIDFTGTGDSEIIAAVTGFLICISTLAFTVGGETNITLKSLATAISGAMDFGGTSEPRGMTHGLGDYPLKTAAGESFVIASSIDVQVSGFVTYYLEPE